MLKYLIENKQLINITNHLIKRLFECIDDNYFSIAYNQNFLKKLKKIIDIIITISGFGVFQL